MSKHESELLYKKVKNLIADDNEEDSDILHSGHPWSLVKLLLLGQWADVYSTIIRHYFESYRFVDLLAGAGKTRIVETEGKLIKGSVFVVDTFASNNPFTNYVLVEENAKRYNALVRRTNVLGDKCVTIHGDCNEIVNQIFLDNTCHNLVFIDNEGFNFSWEGIKTVMGAKADIIINYPTSSFERVTDRRTENALTEFFGDESWREAKFDRDYSAKIYMDNLRHQFEQIKHQSEQTKYMKAYVDSIRVGNDSFFYDIILVCRQGDYTSVWDVLKQKWNRKNPNFMVSVLDYINGKTPSLDAFEGFSKEVSELNKKYPRKKQTARKNSYAKLENFFPR